MTNRDKKPNPLLEIGITVLLPAFILMKLSSPERLGTLGALLLALAFPVGWGLWDGLRRRKLNWFSVLGVVSTLLTGGIGLLKLDAQWLAVKEALVPGLIGVAVLASNFTKSPLIRVLVFNADLFDLPKVNAALAARGNVVPFELRLRTGTFLLAGTFFFSALANYVLARLVVSAPAGTEAFNEQLGKLTLLSYPVIAIPSMLMMMGLMFWLARGAKALTGLDLGDMLQGGAPAGKPSA
ncbi:VC0807 family protein [Rubrivivax rivuli]|uniref:MFS transporter n=1 Tax=Rubrivivax rivuli TaxID=1862385 RepID=A0A437RHB6_9BURK|nr:VC0807 family protein [Rubrivivax rivuli]RVU46160.1 MFS transporter [Rubrivivax rivuli]